MSSFADLRALARRITVTEADGFIEINVDGQCVYGVGNSAAGEDVDKAIRDFGTIVQAFATAQVQERFGVVERVGEQHHMAVIDLYAERASAESYRDSVAGTGRYRIARVLIEAGPEAGRGETKE